MYIEILMYHTDTFMCICIMYVYAYTCVARIELGRARGPPSRAAPSKTPASKSSSATLRSFNPTGVPHS